MRNNFTQTPLKTVDERLIDAVSWLDPFRGVYSYPDHGQIEYHGMKLCAAKQDCLEFFILDFAIGNSMEECFDLITIMGTNDEGETYEPFSLYELPLGSLFNIALDCIYGAMARNPQIANDAEFKANNLGVWTLADGLDELLVQGRKVSSSDVLRAYMLNSTLSVGQMIYDTKHSEYIDSLGGIIFRYFYFIEDAFEKSPIIKRCPTCNKYFFALNGNRKYCAFVNPDSSLKGQTCREAIITRKSREQSNEKTLNNVLSSMRKNYDMRSNKSIPWRIDFEIAYEEARQEHEHDPWKYKNLLAFVRKYDASHPNKKEEDM